MRLFSYLKNMCTGRIWTLYTQLCQHRNKSSRNVALRIPRLCHDADGGAPVWHDVNAHQSPLFGRTPSHRLLLPHGTFYFILIRINNWKKEINVCKLSVLTVGFIGLTLFFERLSHCLWLIHFCMLHVCEAVPSRFYLYSGHCASVWTVDKRLLLLWLLFCCCPVAREQRVYFLQDRVKGKLLIGRSSGLCNNLLIQKLSWAVSGSVEQVTGLLHWGESMPRSLLTLLLNTARFIGKRGRLP